MKEKASHRFKEAARHFKKGRFYDAETVLRDLHREGYRPFEVQLLLARTCGEIAWIADTPEYENEARMLYDSLHALANKNSHKKKAQRFEDEFHTRISSPGEKEALARKKAEELQERTPSTPKAWFVLASNSDSRKDVLFVLDAYEKAIEMNPRYILAMQRQGYLYEQVCRDIPRAINRYLTLLHLEPDDDPVESQMTNLRAQFESACRLAALYREKGMYRKIFSVLDRARQLSDQYPVYDAQVYLRRIVLEAREAARQLASEKPLERYLLQHNIA